MLKIEHKYSKYRNNFLTVILYFLMLFYFQLSFNNHFRNLEITSFFDTIKYQRHLNSSSIRKEKLISKPCFTFIKLN